MRAAALALVLLGACERPPPPAVDDRPAAVSVDGTHALLKTGTIGTQEKSDATYVFVDVKNGSDRDRMVAVDGKLLDAAGKELAGLHWDELRVPAGGIRTFALVSAAPVAGATQVSYRVLRASALDHPAEVDVDEPTFGAHGDAYVASGYVRNHEKRQASVVAAATFYAADGTILARPFTLVKVQPGKRWPVRFEGPKDAAEATLFVGEVTFE
jgi:hypothetical protein